MSSIEAGWLATILSCIGIVALFFAVADFKKTITRDKDEKK